MCSSYMKTGGGINAIQAIPAITDQSTTKFHRQAKRESHHYATSCNEDGRPATLKAAIK